VIGRGLVEIVLSGLGSCRLGSDWPTHFHSTWLTGGSGSYFKFILGFFFFFFFFFFRSSPDSDRPAYRVVPNDGLGFFRLLSLLL
jgi:hypothetical protein